jgi:hypothetical protein
MSQSSIAPQGHAAECCPPDECAWCLKPIEPGQGWARITTTIYDTDHQALKEHWRDYHHTPLSYMYLARQPGGVAGDGGCLWHSEQ